MSQNPDPNARLSRPWMNKVSRLVVNGKLAQALKLLDKIIENDLPLFNETDPWVNEERRLAWLYRIQLLREWDRLSEALAWVCLECELNPGNVSAQALKEQLKRARSFTHRRSSETEQLPLPALVPAKWPGVAGMREVKAILERDVILPMQEPELYRRYKVSLPNGILFYGPPGCGKTFIARKLAEVLKFSFIEVKPSDLASIYVHGGQEKIGSLFKEAKEKAPTLLFIDELDALIPNRGGDTVGHHYRAEVNEFLVQLNECSKARILVIGATNWLKQIDPAALRPGRFDKKIFVGPPDLEARFDLLHVYSEGRPLAEMDWLALTDETDMYTAAEIEELVNESARLALTARKPIETHHVRTALKTVKPSLTPKRLQEYLSDE